MEQDAAHHDGEVRITVEFLGAGVGQQNRQEAEGGVRHEIDDLIGLGTGVDDMERDQQGKHRLEHTCSRDRGQHWREDAGDRVEEAVGQTLFLALGGLRVGLRRGIGGLFAQPRQLIDGGVDMAHIVADNDLELTAAVYNAKHTLGGLELLRVSLCVILQIEAQAGSTVDEGDDVFFSADERENLSGKLLIVHGCSSFDWMILFRFKTAARCCLLLNL